jgi:type I restriction enzyme, S subunit
MKAKGKTKRLGAHLLFNARGKQPEYADDGLPVVNSKHVLRNEVRRDNDKRLAVYDMGSLLIHSGDVLINSTGVGTIGRTAAYLHDGRALPDNHVTILRPDDSLDPVYLAVFLNSIAGQLQVEQRLRGSSGQIELYPSDIAEFRVWLAPKPVQLKIRGHVERSFAVRQRATRLLDAAKRAVEIAIEDSEAAALAHRQAAKLTADAA